MFLFRILCIWLIVIKEFTHITFIYLNTCCLHTLEVEKLLRIAIKCQVWILFRQLYVTQLRFSLLPLKFYSYDFVVVVVFFPPKNIRFSKFLWSNLMPRARRRLLILDFKLKSKVSLRFLQYNPQKITCNLKSWKNFIVSIYTSYSFP